MRKILILIPIYFFCSYAVHNIRNNKAFHEYLVEWSQWLDDHDHHIPSDDPRFLRPYEYEVYKAEYLQSYDRGKAYQKVLEYNEWKRQLAYNQWKIHNAKVLRLLARQSY